MHFVLQKWTVRPVDEAAPPLIGERTYRPSNPNRRRRRANAWLTDCQGGKEAGGETVASDRAQLKN
jgi:hypothetical protein